MCYSRRHCCPFNQSIKCLTPGGWHAIHSLFAADVNTIRILSFLILVSGVDEAGVVTSKDDNNTTTAQGGCCLRPAQQRRRGVGFTSHTIIIQRAHACNNNKQSGGWVSTKTGTNRCINMSGDIHVLGVHTCHTAMQRTSAVPKTTTSHTERRQLLKQQRQFPHRPVDIV